MALELGPKANILIHGNAGEGHYAAVLRFFRGVDLLMQIEVEDKDLTAPPGSPADGDTYIVGGGATGDWATHDDDLARWSEKLLEWEFWTPRAGWSAWLVDEGERYEWTGSSWDIRLNLSSTDLLTYMGVIDCSANPNYPAGDAGDVYFVSVLGKIGGGSGITVDVGDMIICNTDGTTSGNQAAKGVFWNIIQNNLVGAVTNNDTSVTDENPAVFDGTTGKLIKQRTWAQFAALLQSSVKPLEHFIIAASDESTLLTTGTAKVTFRMGYAFTLTDIKASVNEAATGGTLLTVDVNESGSTILSTKLTFDASSKTTVGAATPRVISDSSLAADAEMTIDIDAVGSTLAGKGLKVTFIGYRT